MKISQLSESGSQKIMIKHQQVHESSESSSTKSLMFVLENKINKQHVYRWKNGSSFYVCFRGKFLYFQMLNPLFNIIINCRGRFKAPAGMYF